MRWLSLLFTVALLSCGDPQTVETPGTAPGSEEHLGAPLQMAEAQAAPPDREMTIIDTGEDRWHCEPGALQHQLERLPTAEGRCERRGDCRALAGAFERGLPRTSAAPVPVLPRRAGCPGHARGRAPALPSALLSRGLRHHLLPPAPRRRSPGAGTPLRAARPGAPRHLRKRLERGDPGSLLRATARTPLRPGTRPAEHRTHREPVPT